MYHIINQKKMKTMANSSTLRPYYTIVALFEVTIYMIVKN